MKAVRLLYILCLCSLALPVAGQEWTFRAPMNAPRTGIASAVLDGMIYVLGGEDQFNTVLNTASRYDPAADRWEPLPPMSKARVFAAALAFDGKVFVIGGRDGDGNVLDEVEYYDPAANRWAVFPALLVERQGLTAVTRGTKMFVAGGSNGADQLLETIEVYEGDPTDDPLGAWTFFEEPEVEDLEVTGVITALDAGSITIDTLQFVINAATEILDEDDNAITLSDLAVGMTVEVDGFRDTTGVAVATQIKIEDRGEEEVEVTGVITALEAMSLTVDSLLFAVTDSTEILDENDNPITLGDLAVGMTVEVRGFRDLAGARFATRITIEDRGDEEVDVTGVIEVLGSSSIRVEGLTFVVTSATEILDENDNAITLDSLAVGMTVEVDGFRDVTGVLFAERIKIKDRGNDDEEEGELEFCESQITLNVGDTFNIRDYVQVKDDESTPDWAQVFFTYTEAGANDPTVPADWNLAAFNAGQTVTVVAADTAAGTGNQGQGRYRVYVVRQGQTQFDDAATFRIDDDDDSEVEDAKCANDRALGKRADSSQLGTPRAAFASVSKAGSVLFFGGFGQRGPLDLVQRLNPNDQLEELAPLPSARGNLAAAVQADSVFVIGGHDGSDQILADVLLLNPVSGVWEAMPRLNTARESGAAAAVDGVLYVFGGRDAGGRVLGSIEAFGEAPPTTVADEEEPDGFAFGLAQNYPNPFRARTTIAFTVSATASSRHVRLSVYDLQGRRVAVLVDGVLPPGRHQVVWDGAGRSGVPVGSGMYLYRLRQGDLEARNMMAIVH